MTRSDVVLTVVRYLARLTLVLVAGTLYLTWVVIDQAGKVGTVDPVAVGLVGAAWTLTGSCVTALATLLVSTRSTDSAEPPTPVVVENQPDNPVPVEAGD